MTSVSPARRASLAAGASRRDRLGGATRPRGREPTAVSRFSIGSEAGVGSRAGSRRTSTASNAPPFQSGADDSALLQVDSSFDYDDDYDNQDDDAGEDEQQEDSYADTSVAEMSTPARSSRSGRQSVSATRRGGSSSPAAGSPAAAAAAPSSSRRGVVHGTPAKSGRKSAAAAAAAAAASPFAPSPSPVAAPASSPRGGGGRKPTTRGADRDSNAFGMPFTPAASRPHSPTHEDDDNQAAAALDLSQHDDDAAAASQDAYTPDEHDVSMSGGDGFEYEEERKSAEKPSRRSSGGSRASAAAAPAASADAPSSGGKSKARAPKRAREPKAPLPRPKALGGGRYGRQTFGIVQGQSTLIEEEDENVGSDQEGKIDAFRRTKRTRIAPVAHWALEVPNYVQKFLPNNTMVTSIDKEKPVLAPKIPQQKEWAPRLKPAHKSSAAAANGGGSSNSSRASSAQPKANGPKPAPFPATMKLLDPSGVEFETAAVFKHFESIPLESLGGAGVDPRSLPFPLPHGGKAFEQPEFSSGILMLPPRAKKQLEEANNNEIFYVIDGPVNELSVVVHQTSTKISAKDQFLIPVGNRYSLQNLSTTQSITLHFVLVKPAATWMHEFQAQTADLALQQDEARRRLEAEAELEAQQQEDAEQEEEEEKPRRRGHQQQQHYPQHSSSHSRHRRDYDDEDEDQEEDYRPQQQYRAGGGGGAAASSSRKYSAPGSAHKGGRRK